MLNFECYRKFKFHRLFFSMPFICCLMHVIHLHAVVAYNSIVTLKNHRTGGNYLHSHAHLYPESFGTTQQQVSLFCTTMYLKSVSVFCTTMYLRSVSLFCITMYFWLRSNMHCVNKQHSRDAYHLDTEASKNKPLLLLLNKQQLGHFCFFVFLYFVFFFK